jgi:hypothetical protein
MELMRSGSLKRSLSGFGRGWLNGRRRVAGRSPLKQTRANPSLRSSNTASQPSVVDFLEVNAELPYTTVVEGLEEFLYQSELQPRRLSPVNSARRVRGEI